MTTMTTADAKERFAELINHVSHHKERVLLTRRGKEVAAIVPLEDLQFLQATQDQQDLREAMDALKEVREHGAMTLEELKEEIGTLA